MMVMITITNLGMIIMRPSDIATCAMPHGPYNVMLLCRKVHNQLMRLLSDQVHKGSIACRRHGVAPGSDSRVQPGSIRKGT